MCRDRTTPKPMRRCRTLLKKLPEEVARVQHASVEASVEVWAMDEHRIGLKPILRRVWAPKGSGVSAQVSPRYQWMYVYAFVHPQSGRTTWLLLPSVNVEAFSRALVAFAEEIGAGRQKRVLLVLDGAGWHRSTQLTCPEGIELVFLPPYSPEIQPAERLWPLSNEVIANRVFASLDDLQEAQAERCRWLQDHPEIVHARTSFHWWPILVDAT
jgi:hypothetical protein